jgi:hypothetical protein
MGIRLARPVLSRVYDRVKAPVFFVTLFCNS